jgi:UDP-3-O-[3-hydroxymyristoyl] glucosamine N-acyltransferase
MEFTIEELAAIVGGKVRGDGQGRRITGAGSVTDAGETEITFFGNPRYLLALKTSRAGAALVPTGFDERIAPVPIEVENPSLAFAQVLERFQPPPQQWEPGIHPTAVVAQDARVSPEASVQPHAVIESGAEIGAGAVIGAFCYVGPDVKVGEKTLLHPNVTLARGTVLGRRVTIHSGTVLGSDGFGYEMVNGRHVKIPQTGIVQVDDDVEIGANVTVDRARFGRTWIQEGTKIDNLVQIAHNVVIGRHSIIVSQTGISGSSKLGNYVTLAGQVGIVGHVEVGDQAIVGAQSGVSKSVPKGEIWLGSPACPMTEQKERIAMINRLPKLWARLRGVEEKVAEKLKG